MQAKVYIRQGPSRALIGPIGAWKVGDEVHVPSADRGWPFDDHVEGFDGVVQEVQEDGVALAVAKKAAA